MIKRGREGGREGRRGEGEERVEKERGGRDKVNDRACVIKWRNNIHVCTL